MPPFNSGLAKRWPECLRGEFLGPAVSSRRYSTFAIAVRRVRQPGPICLRTDQPPGDPEILPK